jgi:aspartyl-tRNA synthetase
VEDGVKRLDPLGKLRRTHTCGAPRASDAGREAVLCGWVHRRRDHGGVVFVDLRDRTGLCQVVFKPDTAPAAHERAQELRGEFVVAVRGRFEPRDKEAINPTLGTGEVELVATELRVLNSSETPPFAIEDDTLVDEAVRLRHRIHDLRRPIMQRRLEVRHELMQSMRRVCTELGMLEIETPMLARATPEGARDFLVPSRMHPGEFYALPQSPQIIKQLLMVAGFDRYFQIARCFRDEDQRADRQLEFTQLDLELSFVGVDDVLEVLEEITARAWRDVLGVELQRPFPRLAWSEAMLRYGSDRPDTRIELELVDLSDAVSSSEFKVFADVVRKGGVVRALPIPDADAISRSELDRLVDQTREWGAKGMAWVRVAADGTWQSPIAKYLADAERARISERAALRPGHLLLFIADRAPLAADVLGRLRVELGARLGRSDGRPWAPLLVVDFPLFEEDGEGGLRYMHQPFVAPLEEDEPLISTTPLEVRGTHYDVVVNGVELGSGSLRNHRSDVQLEILGLLGYSEERAREDFGFLLEALDSGAPPHGGFAFGLDRFSLLLSGGDSLRDVLAFPKTQRAQDLFMQAPSPVSEEQLRELHVRVRRPRGGDGE